MREALQNIIATPLYLQKLTERGHESSHGQKKIRLLFALPVVGSSPLLDLYSNGAFRVCIVAHASSIGLLESLCSSNT